MAHLHTLHIRPQIYVDLLEGDDKHPFYLYVGDPVGKKNCVMLFTASGSPL